MKEAFENQGTNSLLTYELQPQDQLDGVSLRALANRKLNCCAMASFSQAGQTKFIRYNITGKTSVTKLLGAPLTRARVLNMLGGILSAMQSVDENRVDPKMLFLDTDHIFSDAQSGETVMICLPVARPVPPQATLSMLLKYIMGRVQPDSGEDGSYVGQIQAYLNSTPTVSLSELKSLLDSIAATEVRRAPAPAPAAAPVWPQNGPGRPNPVPAPVQERPAAPVYSGGPVSDTPPQANVSEKNMSMFYLLQHYNKENAALYKEQKNAKKTAKAAAKQNPSVPYGGNQPYAPQQPAPQPYTPAQPAPQPYNPPAPPAPQPHAPVQSAPQQPAPQPYNPPVQPQNVSPVSPLYTASKSVNGGYLDPMAVDSDPGATTVLDPGQLEPIRPQPYLIRVKNGERISVNKPVFRIGKERSYVDYFVSDNTAVSRAHANIISRDGEYFIVDTNSTNHTYINGGMIPSNVETRLAHDAKLRLANEDFEFKLY